MTEFPDLKTLLAHQNAVENALVRVELFSRLKDSLVKNPDIEHVVFDFHLHKLCFRPLSYYLYTDNHEKTTRLIRDFKDADEFLSDHRMAIFYLGDFFEDKAEVVIPRQILLECDFVLADIKIAKCSQFQSFSYNPNPVLIPEEEDNLPLEETPPPAITSHVWIRVGVTSV